MKSNYVKVGSGKQIIDDIEMNIVNECKNPQDYGAYVDNCLLHDPAAAASFYHVTEEQIKYYCSRALLRLTEMRDPRDGGAVS